MILDHTIPLARSTSKREILHFVQDDSAHNTTVARVSHV